MKVQSLLTESVQSILDVISDKCESDKPTCANYLATLVVLKDAGKLYQTEEHVLQKNTYIDFLYGSTETTVRALNLFYRRIQENPRARRLHARYVEQFMDDAYGHVIMRNRIETLRKYFDDRRTARLKYHENRLVDNIAAAQSKIADQHREQHDLSNGDAIRDEIDRTLPMR